MDLNESKLEMILNHISDGLLVVNCEGIIHFCNSAAQKILTNGKGIIGQDVRLVIPNTRLPIVLDTGIEDVNQLQKLGSTTVITNHLPIRDKTGKVMGAVAIFRDISEVKELRKQIRSLQEIKIMLSAILEATQDAITVVDENGVGILINPAYTRLTGLTEEDVINKPATVDIAEGESMHLKVLETRQSIKGFPMKVGHKRKEVLVDGSPIIVNGKLRGSVGVIHDVSEIRRLSEELEGARRLINHLKSEYTISDIIGESKAMRSTVESAISAARTPVTVLLRGESGTGKELFAHAIHHASNRANHNFIRINCAALSDSILESELFGYVEGAFTGAKKGGKIGLFEEANGGTLLLDEIGDINFVLQTKLLRVLQEKEIVRVGSNKPITVNVRIIAATNANLEEKIKDGLFREDLYYRLNVYPIYIPPLRQRLSDINLLTTFIINKFNQEYGRSVKGISPVVLQTLMSYSWPGNVRELENFIARAIISMRSNETIIEIHHLPPLELKTAARNDFYAEPDLYYGKTFEEAYAQWEKEFLMTTIKVTEGNKTKAAQLLKISLRNLYYKMERHGIG